MRRDSKDMRSTIGTVSGGLRSDGRAGAGHYSACARRDAGSATADRISRHRLFLAHSATRGIRPTSAAPLR